MKKLLFFLLFSQLLMAQVFETVPILENGPKEKRINMAVLGDGFTAAQQSNFIADANSLITYLFSKAPFAQYKNYFNVYAIKVISAESGVKHPGTATDVTEPVIPVSNPNNFLGSSFDIGNVHRCLYTNSLNKTTQVLASNVPDFDIAFVLGNSTEYGGCGGTYAFLSRNSNADEILVHELGHSFGKLADEYWFSGSGESPNKTKDNNPATNRWKNWLGDEGVGIYPYTESPTWFRPHQNCEMRYLNREFCAVCRQQIIERVHTLQNPIDSFVPINTSSVSVGAPVTFTVNEILPVPNTLSNTWTLNGTALAGTQNSVQISPAQLNPGNNTLLFTVVDNNPLLRVDNHASVHISTITWALTKTLAATDIRAAENNFTLYPNPVAERLYIKNESSNFKNARVEFVDMSGRSLRSPKVQNVSNNVISVDVSELLPQQYVVKVLENNTLILTHKILKE